MSAFGLEGFATVQAVEVELYTAAYRIDGTVHTPFRRVAEILNQLTHAHLAVEGVTVTEHAAPEAVERVGSALVTVDEILVLFAPNLAGEPRAEMRIEKQRARARLSLPPLHLDGTIHVPVGSRPVDGLLNVPDRFVAMTEVAITSSAYPALERTVPILALQRDRAHVIAVIEPDEEAGEDEAIEAEAPGEAGDGEVAEAEAAAEL